MRVHLIFVVMIIAELLWSMVHQTIGWPFMAMAMASLFLLVLLHEYGHCIACRRMGGTADQILMWPLGGLAFCEPPDGWKPAFVTTLGGPLVNAVLWPVLGAVLWWLAGPGAVIFNPFDPKTVMTGLHMGARVAAPYWLLAALFWVYYTNAVLLVFNLVPMLPLDGGRLLRSLIWARRGETAASWASVTVGMVAAAVLFILGTVWDQSTLVGIAILGAVVCWLERRRLRFAATAEVGIPGVDYGKIGADASDEPRKPVPKEPSRGEVKRKQREEEEQAEVDGILAKIAGTGMSSLTKAERKALERATERRRGR